MNRKLRLVLDTNVFLVSLAPKSLYYWIYQALIQGNFTLCLSTEILLEYQEVIAHRYGLSQTDSTLDFLLLLPNVELFTPFYKWQLIEQDADDNKFVDCAVAGNADFIVSNDKHFNLLGRAPFIRELKVLKYEELEIQFKDALIS